MKKFFEWLENLENNSGSANKHITNFPKLLWKVAMRSFTLLTWMVAVGTVDGIRIESGSSELLWLYIIMFGMLLIGIFASILQVLFPIMENIENKIKERWSYPVAFIIRIALAITSTALVIFFIALPITDMVIDVIEVIGSVLTVTPS